jgi:hypothetical protein
MAISNKDRISRTLDLLRHGLVPFVELELEAKLEPAEGGQRQPARGPH